MTSPVKPWENARVADPASLGLQSSSPGMPKVMVGSGGPPGGPPLPPRARTTRSAVASSLYGPSFASPFGAYPSPSYYPSAYSSAYSSSFQYPFGAAAHFRRSPSDDFESRFVQLAEESSQPAFNSIESFVRTFSSMTMMLESSYQAMYMSFRAVLSMADNMSKMRTMFINFLSNLAILKSLYFLYRKLLYMLGLVRENPLREEVWAAAAEVEKTIAGGKGKSMKGSSWPVVAFFALLFGAPYLMLKLAPTDPDGNLHSGRIKVTALYDFQAPAKGELSFVKGDVLSIPADFSSSRKRHAGWVMAEAANGASGLVPLNYFSRTCPKASEGQAGSL